MTQPEPARCGVACDQYPETTCTDLAGHTGPHGGPLIVNGKEIGGAAWGPDQPEPAKPRHPHDRADEDDERPVETVKTTGEYLTQPTDQSGACLLDACTRQCTTECREAVNRTWHLLRGTTDEPAQPRHTVDTLTDPMLTTLYNERDMLGREGDRLRKDWVEMRTRAERAEATLNAVRDELTAIHLEVGRHRGNSDPETLGYRLGLAAADRQLRAVLDQHGQTTA